MKDTKFERMERVLKARLPKAKSIEILFSMEQKKEKRYQVTIRVDGEMDIQTITKSELNAV
jgi:hypothetical protein